MCCSNMSFQQVSFGGQLLSLYIQLSLGAKNSSQQELSVSSLYPLRMQALWQISDEDLADAEPRAALGSSAMQGHSLSARGPASLQQGFTQILNHLEVWGSVIVVLECSKGSLEYESMCQVISNKCIPTPRV